MTPAEVTPDEFNRVVAIAWMSSLAIAAVLTVPAFLLHRFLIRTTRMLVVSAVVALASAAFVYFLAALTLMVLVSLQLRPPRNETGSEFTIVSIYYHPGLAIKLSILGAVIVTWLALALWKRRVVRPRTPSSN
jgi:hypothetical protein